MAEAVAPVAIAFGSNLGDRSAHLAFAVERLSQQLSSLRVSRVVETEPVGVGDQPLFLNGVLTATTTRSPTDLLDDLLALERERRRERPWPGAPRTLDLDLILYGDAIIETDRLTVPHPRFRERQFVLEPLSEIAADWIDPVTGRTVAELWRAFQRTHST
jgi:2-amino-4-hydroxy-6-hydroxymethyldihydropteridine diphosphokinase